MLDTVLSGGGKTSKAIKRIDGQMNELVDSLKETHKEKLKLFESLRTFENDREMMRKKERRREDAWKEMLGTAKVNTDKAEEEAKRA